MAICRICKLSLKQGEGFVLTTRDAVNSPALWEERFTSAVLGLKHKYGKEGIPPEQANKKYLSILYSECGQKAGRLICSGCMIEYPEANRDQAQKNAGEFWKSRCREDYSPEGGGSVSPHEAAKIAGPVWKKMTGIEPPEIKPPAETKGKGCLTVFILTALIIIIMLTCF